MVQVRGSACSSRSIGRHDSSGALTTRLLRWGLCLVQFCCSSGAGSASARVHLLQELEDEAAARQPLLEPLRVPQGPQRSSALFRWGITCCCSSRLSSRIKSRSQWGTTFCCCGLHQPLPYPMVLHQATAGAACRWRSGTHKLPTASSSGGSSAAPLSCVASQSVASGSSTGDVGGAAAGTLLKGASPLQDSE